MRRLTRVTATILTAVVLVGCQPTTSPTAPTPSPSPSISTPVPTPTYMCTPEAGGQEAPCTQAEYDEMKAKDALYAEAEAVYQRLFAENIRISRAGGTAEPTSVILETTEGAFRDNVMSIFREMADEGTRARGEDPTLAIERAPGISKQGSIVALSICVNATRWAFYNGEKQVSQGRIGLDLVYFKRFDMTLKIIGADGRFVDSCEPVDA